MNVKICFIGAGNMAQSLIGGLIASGYDRKNIIATDPTQAQRNNVTERFGIHCYDDNAEAISMADIVVLAVKPQVLESVCLDIQAAIQAKKPLVVSVAAGIRVNAIDHWLGMKMLLSEPCQIPLRSFKLAQPVYLLILTLLKSKKAKPSILCVPLA